MNSAHEIILNIERPFTTKGLKPLIGLRFPIRSTTRSWGRELVDTDELEITHINCQVEVGSGAITGQVMVYSNYFFNGNIRFNAWTSVDAVQKYINKYIEHSARESV